MSAAAPQVTASGAEHGSRKDIAALADDALAGAVLTLAGMVAALFNATVKAVHAGERDKKIAAAANDAGVALTTVAGRPVDVLARASAAEDVVAVVLGARGGREDRPAGSTALPLISLLQKPVVVLPSGLALPLGLESVLVPLDGTAASAAALREIVELASGAELRIVVAHVHLRRALPAFSDHLPHEVRAWSEEFIARYCPGATDATLESRVGDGKPQEHVLDILRQGSCDLVALGWRQDLAEGHAAVVRRMLTESPVPVLLAPIRGDLDFAPAEPAPAERPGPS
jgi:hypothetical protein